MEQKIAKPNALKKFENWKPSEDVFYEHEYILKTVYCDDDISLAKVLVKNNPSFSFDGEDLSFKWKDNEEVYDTLTSSYLKRLDRIIDGFFHFYNLLMESCL